jgi:hypothetical protein
MDITDRFLEITQSVKVFSSDPYKNRFISSEVSSTDRHYISESSSLLFLLIETSKSLKELNSESNTRVNFYTQTNRIKNLSDKIENNIKIAQMKLEEIQHIEIPSCCSESIHNLLQKRLFTVTKDFQLSLQAQTKQLKSNQDKKALSSEIEVISKDKPTFLDDIENQ